MLQKRIAVIGAGPCGLTAIKACKEEDLDVVCFERTDTFGGLWRYREPKHKLASTMKTTVSNTSKEMMAFSDFPPPKDFPNILHHKKVLEYLTLYAENFDLLQHIRYYQEVVKVTQCENFDDTGQWIVTFKDISKDDSEALEEVFDGVMVCIGHHVFPNQPTFRNQHNFKGKMIHSKFLKTVAEYEDKNVLIIGLGNSAVDAATEISNAAKQVYISTRRGSWIFPRVGPKGIPTDTIFCRRYLNVFTKISYSIACSYVEKVLDTRLNHSLYKIKPEHRALSQQPTVSDDLPDKILTGRVIIKGEVARFEEHGVLFQGESKPTDLDAVILATGYQIKFPFLEDRIILTVNGDLNLYKFVFPVGLKHPTLAIMGLCQPIGAVLPIAESQCRWASLVFNQKIRLPSEEAMIEKIQERKRQISKRFVNTPRHSIQVDYIDYMDDLAVEYGVKPNLCRLLFKDPSLFWACFFGPTLPYQFRLQGPHSWEGARDAILNFQQRLIAPLNRKSTTTLRKTAENASKQSSTVYICFIAFFLYLILMI